MKTVLIAIERSSFTYLYKFGYIQVSKGQILDYTASEARILAESNSVEFVNKLESRLPHFEQEHEVLILEISQVIDVSQSIFEVDFEQIQQIIPLNPLAKELVEAKSSDNITVSESFSNRFYQHLIEVRQHKIRSRCANSLVTALKQKLPNLDFRKQVQRATLIQIRGQAPGIGESTLAHVLDFNITPSFIPEGLIEGLIKLICVGAKKLGADVNSVPKGIVYKTLIEGVDHLNSADSFVTSFGIMVNLFESKESETQEKFIRLKSTLGLDGLELNSLLVIYLYYSYRKFLQKREFNLELLGDKIFTSEAPNEVAAAIYMIGYTLSMPLLFESLHQIRKAPVFSVQNFNVTNKVTYQVTDTHLKAEDSVELYEIKKKSQEKPKQPKKAQQSSLFETSSSSNSEHDRLIKKLKVMLKGSGKKQIIAIVEELLSKHYTPQLEEFQNRFLQEQSLVKTDGSLYKRAEDALKLLQEEFQV